jgi:DNA-directed RNA polymerase specialized sigma24 family protein
MALEGSVTHWIGQLKGGDPAAAGPLWERFFRRLVGLTRKKLQGRVRRAAAGEEDVALSAFASFCRNAEAGRFPHLKDRDGLWQLLATIAARKAADLARGENRQKRGGKAVLDEAALDTPDGSRGGLAALVAREPTPALAAQLGEEYRRLMAQLGDATLRSIAVWKMEGYGTSEIATMLGCAPSTVERKLRRIRSLWAHETGG